MGPRTNSNKIAEFLIARTAWLFLNFLGKTSRIHWLGKPEKRDALLKEHRNIIYAFWHGRQVFLAYAHRNSPADTLVSQSKDGSYIAKVIDYFGMGTVRGSSSRGGAKALILLKNVLESGRSIAITPDGPRGPQRQVADGILFLARKMNKPILPTVYSARRKLVFKGWDDFWVPLPFNRIVVGYGNPVSIGPDDDLGEKSKELERELNALTDRADWLCRSENAAELKKLPSSDTPLYPPASGMKETLFYFFYTSLMFLFSPIIVLSILVRYPKSFPKEFFKGLSMRLGLMGPVNEKLKGGIWIHAASLGECRAALPLVRDIRERTPEKSIIFSSATAVGIAEAEKLKLGDRIVYAPVDIPWVLDRVFKSFAPKTLLLLESELWPNWIRAAKRSGIKVGVVNGRISERSARRYAKLSWITEVYMGKIDLVAARETADAERFRSIGVPLERVSVGGNLKYDILPWDLQPGKVRPESVAGKDASLYWTAGSVRAGEEEPVLNAYAEILKSHPGLKLIFAPRHLDRMGTVTGILKSLDLSFTLRSEALKGTGALEAQVLIWDTFGDLWQAYRQATLVFVGGSLADKGGQNPIEPAWFGKPVLFGPSMSNFAEPAKTLLEAKGALEVRDSKTLAETICRLLSNTNELSETGARSKKAVEGFFGLATQKTSDALRKYDIL